RLMHLFHHCYYPHRDLHPFPTRRSSDLRDVVSELLNLLPLKHAEESKAPESDNKNGENKTKSQIFGSSSILAFLAELVRSYNPLDRKSTRLNSSHVSISYAVFCLKKKKH